MTIVASWGGSTATSYLALTDAASFVTTALIYTTPWTDATSVKQEAALISATRQIDARQYVGERFYVDQILEFPRRFSTHFAQLTTTTSLLFTPDQVRMERAVKEATCHQAVWLLRRGGRNIHAEHIASGISEIRETTGPLTDFVKYSSRRVITLNPEASLLLQPWMEAKRVVRK